MADLLEFSGLALGDVLPDALRAKLSAAAQSVAYPDGKLIHRRGDAKPGLSIVQSGAVRFVYCRPDGENTTSSIVGPGHCFGEATLFANLPRAYDAMAVGPTVVEQITKARIEDLLVREPALTRCLLEVTTRRLYGALEFLEDLRSLPIQMRAAKLILTMASSSKAKDVVECTQSDIAFTLGVSRVSAGAALGALQDAGYIRLGYGRIEIADEAGMRSWLDFDERGNAAR